MVDEAEYWRDSRAPLLQRCAAHTWRAWYRAHLRFNAAPSIRLYLLRALLYAIHRPISALRFARNRLVTGLQRRFRP